MLSRSAAITELLRAWSGGDGAALERLADEVYHELHRMARRYMKNERQGDTLQTTALVHEVYLRLCGQDEPQWEDRAHFFAVAARMMRRILVDYSRRRGADKRGADAVHVPGDILADFVDDEHDPGGALAATVEQV